MLGADALTRVLNAAPVLPLSGVMYRAVVMKALVGDPPYEQMRPLYTEGSARRGARFTPLNGMPCLYLASDPETALAEVHNAYAKLRRQDPPMMAAIPATAVFSVDVKLDAVLDLTDAAVQALLGTTPGELASPDWRAEQARGVLPETQRLAKAAAESGHIQAMRYVSTQLPEGRCLVVFAGRVGADCYVQVNDAGGYLRERLPP